MFRKTTGLVRYAALSAGLMLSSMAFGETVPASDDRHLQEADLMGLSAITLRIARNEIFARHGYKFNSGDLRSHFSQYSWYYPRTKNVSLSAVEQSNVAFIKRYETSPALQQRLFVPAAQAPAVNQTVNVVVEDGAKLEELQKSYDDVAAKLAALEAVLAGQLRKSTASENPKNVHALAATEIESSISTLKSDLQGFEDASQAKYQTPIRPSVDFSKSSPRELSRNFPKIPWYDPAYIDETGEFWIEPVVSDQGVLEYMLRFIEPDQATQNVASSFALGTEDAILVRDSLQKTFEWSQTAAENNVRVLFRKSVGCTPEALCKEKVQGNTSTQVDFLVFEGGAVGARLIRNKGAYPEEFGMSIESAALLASYFDYMIDAGEADMEAGTRTQDDLNSLFD